MTSLASSTCRPSFHNPGLTCLQLSWSWTHKQSELLLQHPQWFCSYSRTTWSWFRPWCALIFTLKSFCHIRGEICCVKCDKAFTAGGAGRMWRNITCVSYSSKKKASKEQQKCGMETQWWRQIYLKTKRKKQKLFHKANWNVTSQETLAENRDDPGLDSLLKC